MCAEAYRTLELIQARRDLAQIVQEVARNTGRVEITRRGSRDRCVIISKQELDSLERALQILSDTEAIKAVRQSLEQVAQAAATSAVPQEFASF